MNDMYRLLLVALASGCRQARCVHPDSFILGTGLPVRKAHLQGRQARLPGFWTAPCLVLLRFASAPAPAAAAAATPAAATATPIVAAATPAVAVATVAAAVAAAAFGSLTVHPLQLLNSCAADAASQLPAALAADATATAVLFPPPAAASTPTPGIFRTMLPALPAAGAACR